MSNLLDKASVILTPTAYNNGEALCVKPSDGSGDFDFSRNSAATRVNAQGLVENVQILSSNLVQNGDFSEEGVQEVSNGSFSQESAELVTNGDFATDSDWTKATGVTISNGDLNFDNVASGNGAYQSLPFTSQPFSKVVVVCSDYVSGSLQVRAGTTSNSERILGVGTYTYYLPYSNYNYINFFIDTNFTGSIESVSVREVGQDWEIENTWTIGDGVANGNGAVGSTSELKQYSVNTIGKTYKATFEVLNYVSGTVGFWKGSGVTVINRSADGIYTEYFTATSAEIRFRPNNFNGSITNISVKEVGMDWTLGTGWEIGEDKVLGDGTMGANVFGQNVGFIQGNSYKFSFTIEDYVSGSIYIREPFNGYLDAVNSNGNYSFYYVAGASNQLDFRGNSFVGSITNISIIEITDDTNLPRINYEGFSYQDVLGSEQISNGSFDTDTNWTKGIGFSISGGSANCDGTQSSNTFLKQQGGILGANIDFVVGKTYKVNFDIIVTSGQISNVEVASGYDSNNITTSGNHTTYITAVSTNDRFTITANPDFIGSIDNVSVKEYLGQSVIPNSGCGSWLFEPQSTNLVPYSEDFSNSYYAKSSVTLTSGFLAPDGSNNAYKVAGTIGSSYLGNLTANTHLRSIYVRTVSGTGQIKLIGSVDLFDVTEQWTRVSYNPQSSTYQFAVDFRGGTNISEVLIWGMQVEQQSYATSYIPTSGSTVTRNQDLCTNGGSLATINSTEGVLYAEISIDTTLGVGSDITLIDSSNTSDYIRFTNDGGTNKVNMYFRYNGVSNFHTFIGDTTIFKKYAIQWGNGEVNYYVNGVLKETDFTTMPSLNVFDKLHFSQTGSSNRAFTGNIKAVAVWKEALTAQELTELTTI